MQTHVSDKRLSKLGFGCGRIGSFNNPMSSRDTQRLLEHALEIGVTLFDTADIYGQGDSERMVGRVLRGRADTAFVVTKVGQTFSTAMRVLRPFKPLLKPLINRSATARAKVSGQRGGAMATDLSPAYVAKAIDRSLSRLGLETIDALLLHSPRAEDILVPALDAVFEKARKGGKIRHFGVACDDVACVEAALRFPDLGFLEVAPPVLDAASGLIGEAVLKRGIKVLVREAIRFRGAASPGAMVSGLAARSDVASVVVGTTSASHLDDLVHATRQGVGGSSSGFLVRSVRRSPLPDVTQPG